ncbi:MAG: FAD-dependent oxidoreductase, partial [Clostridia bacterium]|nr:FAD-dependent oxidoreductase [Clostridia bacterium]
MIEYDVVVCGGGFAGASAAIAAGRRGARVLLVDATNCLGGAAAEALVNPFMPYYTKNGE